MMTREMLNAAAPSRAEESPTRFVNAQWRCLTFLVASLFLAVDQPMHGQNSLGTETTQGPPITAHVKVVNVLATVRDKKGGIVRGLDRDDFELKEDDRPQDIRYFSHRSEE